MMIRLIVFLAIYSMLNSLILAQNSYTETVFSEQSEGKITTHYVLDGLGRIRADCSKEQSPNHGDIINIAEFDEFGRRIKEYQPYEGDGTLSLPMMISSQSQYYRTAIRTAHTSFPFAEFVYEPRPVKVLTQRSAPGFSWSLSQGNCMQYAQGVNDYSEIRNLTLMPGDTLAEDGFYPPASVLLLEEINEDGQLTKVFQSPDGRTLMSSRSSQSAVPVKTYYVYDAFGRLRLIIPPKAVRIFEQQNSFDINSLTEDLLLRYEYDEYGHLISQYLPGQGSTEFVYDKLDRLLMRRDASQLADSLWWYAFYDGTGRTCEEGLIKDLYKRSREYWQTYFDSLGEVSSKRSYNSNSRYTHPDLPTNIVIRPAIKYFYDDYDGLPTQIPPNIYNSESLDDCHGIMTGMSSRVLDATSSNWIDHLFYYDKDYNISANELSLYPDGVYWSFMQYDLLGKILSKEEYWAQNEPGIAPLMSREMIYEYDHAARNNRTVMVFDGDTSILAEMVYNGIGQLVETNLGAVPDANDYLQSLDLCYNTRGWLTHMNNAELDNDLASIAFIMDDESESLNAMLFDELSIGLDSDGQDIRVDIEDESWLEIESSVNSNIQFVDAGGFESEILEAEDLDSLGLVQIQNIDGETFTVDLQNLQLFEGMDIETLVDTAINLLVSELAAEGVFEPHIIELLSLKMASYFRRKLEYAWFNDDNNDLWGMELEYENPGAFASPRYSGIVSQMKWKTGDSLYPTLAYGFSYDFMNRITAADYLEKSSGGNWSAVVQDYSCGPYTYDANGNLLSLKRKGMTGIGSTGNSPVYGVLDDLQYSYDGNQLQAVSEFAINVEAGMPGYEANSIQQGIIYDVLGRMISDPARGISINYNEIGLPETIDYQDSHTLIITYDASGRKLSQRKIEANQVSETLYREDLILRQGQPIFLKHPFGRVSWIGSYTRIDYDLKDHLGNTRIIFSDIDADHKADVIQENHYYPFGMLMTGKNTYCGTVSSPYLYNGKEKINDAASSFYDYGARYYDPVLARWHVQDPLNGKHSDYSPYAYVYNDPVSLTDPFGLDSVYVLDQLSKPVDNKEYTATIFVIVNGQVFGPYSGSSFPDLAGANTLTEGNHQYNNLYGHAAGSRQGLNLVNEHGSRTSTGTDEEGSTVNMSYVNVHDSKSSNRRNSAGCITLPQGDPDGFFDNFDWSGTYNGNDGTTGTSTGTLILQRGPESSRTIDRLLIMQNPISTIDPLPAVLLIPNNSPKP